MRYASLSALVFLLAALPGSAAAQRGPKFCRSGAGHPVHGQRWCVEKGFGLGHPRIERDRRERERWVRDHRREDRWERERWNDVVFYPNRYRERRDAFGARVLIDIVGGRVYGRLELVRDRMGGRYPLTARWLRTRWGEQVLQVRSGPLVIAELSDLNGDGRVDMVLAARR